jgi:hypothetical protein
LRFKVLNDDVFILSTETPGLSEDHHAARAAYGYDGVTGFCKRLDDLGKSQIVLLYMSVREKFGTSGGIA